MLTIASLVLTITGVIAGILALMSDELKENRRLKYIIVAVLMALSIYAMLGGLLGMLNTPTANTAKEYLSDVPIAVDSTNTWQSSGISVLKGDTISVEVVGGKWTTGRYELPSDIKTILPAPFKKTSQIFQNRQYEQSGNGVNFTCLDYPSVHCPIENAPWGSLIARIDIGEPFVIGKSNTFIASKSGTIYLRINDDSNYSDNFGVLAVVIKVQ